MVLRRRSSNSAARVIVLASISMSRPLSIVQGWGVRARGQDATARRFEQRDDATQLVRTACAREVDGGRKLVRLEAGEARDGGAAILARQALVAANSPARGFTERTHGRRMQCLATAETHGEVAGAANLLRERATCALLRRRQRAEAHAAAPERERNQEQRERDDRRAVQPGELEQRGVFLLGQKMDDVPAVELRGGDE